MKHLCVVMILFCFGGAVATAQRADADAMANRNEYLETLLLDYKQQLLEANKKIERLMQENQELKIRINALLNKQNKTLSDINQLKIERKHLLDNNETLKRTIEDGKRVSQQLKDSNQRLALENELLANANRLLEEASIASDTIQKYQDITIQKQKEGLGKIIETTAMQCARLTGEYKVPLKNERFSVVLNRDDAPKNSIFEQMTIEACYHVQRREIGDKITVYFRLYDPSHRIVLRDIPFSLNRTTKEEDFSFFEGSYTFPTNEKFELANDQVYYFEIHYRENVIAKGQLNAS